MKSFCKIGYFIIFGFLIFSSSRTVAQNTIAYGYDNNGNRTSRVLSVQKSAFIELPADEKQVKAKENLTDTESSIKIYPNPTKGIIKISLENYNDLIKGNYQLYDLKGTVLKQSRFDSQMTEINMSNMSSGLYVLRIVLNGKRTDYKVIKQN